MRTTEARIISAILLAGALVCGGPGGCKDEQEESQPGPEDVVVAGDPDGSPADAQAEDTPGAPAEVVDAGGGEVAAPDSGEDAGGDPDSGAPPPPPFMVGEGDHVGVAVVDITPQITETYDDLNGNHVFDGCRYDPEAKGEGCEEPFDDANGNGEFDAVFIAGFGGLRAAMGVHDPIEVRALVFARGKEYLAMVAVDVVGLGSDRIEAAVEMLAAQGYEPGRILVASTHNHQGPDVRGLWGNPDPAAIWPGADPEYNESVSKAIAEAATKAAAALEPVASLRMGAVRMRKRSEWFNGKHFGGKNPKERVHGLLNDIRDPIVVSDQVFALRAVRSDGTTVATLASFAGHAEVLGDENDLLSADYVHYLRKRLESKLGGHAVYFPECLGGMQSALGSPVPLVDEDGSWVFATDQSGAEVPEWAPKDSFDLARSVGVHVGDAAIAALESGKDAALEPFVVESAPFYVPIDNGVLAMLFELGLFDVGPSAGVKDPALCPEYSPADPLHPGCIPTRVWRVRLGPAGFLTAPGELFPEVFWGLPVEDPRWLEESSDPGARGTADGRDSVYFPQHPPACDAVDYEECRKAFSVGECDCTRMHDVPYAFHPEPAMPALRDLLDTEYRFLIGNVSDHLGYILPENDFNLRVGLLAEQSDGDHYEETVSASRIFSTKLQSVLSALP